MQPYSLAPSPSSPVSSRMRWFVRGDIDGFFGLALDNLVQLLLIDTLCRFVLGFPPELVYGRVLPGAAVSMLVGNLFYACQAKQLAARTGRTDVCALPYGINTVSLFAHVFLVMLPAKALATAAGAADPARVAWQAGLVATLCSGVIELAGAFVAERVRKATPRAALLSTLAGIALGFISLGFLFRTFARPIVGLTTFGDRDADLLRPRALQGPHSRRRWSPSRSARCSAWVTGIAPVGARRRRRRRCTCRCRSSAIWSPRSAADTCCRICSVIVAMGLFNVLGSLQNIESAEAAGDAYDDAAVADDQRRRQHRRGALRLGVSDDDLHRASRAGRRSARAPATRC